MRDPLDKLSKEPINFGRRSTQNSTLQNSLAVKSSDHSWLLRRYFRFSGGVFAKRYRRMTRRSFTAWLAVTSRSSRLPSGRCSRPITPQYRPGFCSIAGISSLFAM